MACAKLYHDPWPNGEKDAPIVIWCVAWGPESLLSLPGFGPFLEARLLSRSSSVPGCVRDLEHDDLASMCMWRESMALVYGESLWHRSYGTCQKIVPY